MRRLLTVLLLARRVLPSSLAIARASCEIFCFGKLLETVQAAHLHADSKTFVDRPLLMPPSEVLAAFAALPEQPGREELSAFVEAHFGVAGSDLHPHTQVDWSPAPPAVIAALRNDTLRAFLLEMHAAWPSLGRVTSPDVLRHPGRHSLLSQPFPLVVPGGRFREAYAWDALWIVQGLLISGMTDSARGLARNTQHLVETFGFTPNGGRAYYALPGRSQPPVFSSASRTRAARARAQVARTNNSPSRSSTAGRL
jgi:alpha,alpha-trehalase